MKSRLGTCRFFAAVAALCLGGCSSLSFGEPPTPSIRTLTITAARECRLIGQVSVNSPTETESAQLRETMALAGHAATTMGGNALLVESVSTATRPGMTTGYSYTVAGQAYSCPQ
jgi:hypothetical protein